MRKNIQPMLLTVTLAALVAAVFLLSCSGDGSSNGTPEHTPTPTSPPSTATPTPSSTPLPASWSAAFGLEHDDQGVSVITTSDLGYVIAGNSTSYSNSNDIVVIKVDATGKVLWEKQYGYDSTILANAMISTFDECFVLVGGSSLGVGFSDIFLIKLANNGGKMWERSHGGAYYDEGYGLAQATDNGFFLAGIVGRSPDNMDAGFIKTNIQGNQEWELTMGEEGLHEYATGACLSQEGRYIVCGYTVDIMTGNTSSWLAKIHASAGFLWKKDFSPNPHCHLVDIIPASDEGFIAVGYTDPANDSVQDFWLLKVDAEGNQQWQHIYGSAADEKAYALCAADDGGYVVVGSTTASGLADVYLIKTSANGELQWEKTYGGAGNDEGRCVKPAHGSGYIIVGYTESFGAGGKDIYVIKTDQQGNVE